MLLGYYLIEWAADFGRSVALLVVVIEPGEVAGPVDLAAVAAAYS